MDQFDHDMHQALTEIQAEANADISETAQSVSEQTNAQTHHSAHSKESVIHHSTNSRKVTGQTFRVMRSDV